MIDFKCSCGKELKVPDTLARKRVTCNQCGRKDILLPGPGQKLDLGDYEIEDAGTIVLEAPSVGGVLPRKQVDKQVAVAKKQSRRAIVPGKRENGNIDSKKSAEVIEQPARASQNTSRLEAKESVERSVQKKSSEKQKKEVDTPKAQKQFSRDKKKPKKKAEAEQPSDDESDMRETKIVLQPHTSKTDGALKNARSRGDKEATRNRRTKSASENEDFTEYNKNQRMIYIVIGAIVVLFAILYFAMIYQNKPKPIATESRATPEEPAKEFVANQEPVAPKVAPKVATVEAPAYEKITEVGSELIKKFRLSNEDKESLVQALEARRQQSVQRKLNSKTYDSYIKEILEKKLAYALAFNDILNNAKPEKEEHLITIYRLQSLINFSSNINSDKELMKDFPLDLSGVKVQWAKDKLEAFLDAVKSVIDSKYTEVNNVSTRADWASVIDIVKNGRVEDDIAEIPLMSR